MTALIYQLSIPGMAGKRLPSSPKQFRADLIKRTESARIVSGLSREEVVDRLREATGQRVTMAAYKKWETRTFIPHMMIIPFCDITGTDPYLLLTGTPFRIGRNTSADGPESSVTPFRKAKPAA